MKLIIDIPDHIYELAKENKLKYWTQGITDNIVFKALANGTPYKEKEKGEWLKKESNIVFGRNYIYQCSVCKAVVDNQFETKFCPCCGADMRTEDDDIPMEYFENGGI